MQSGQRRVTGAGWLRVATATALALALPGSKAPLALAADVPPNLARLLLRSASYVRDFQRSFSEVVSSEHYEQTVRRTGGRTSQMRHIESEMFFAAVGDGAASMTIRNVTRVDGHRVPDSHDRVMRVLSSRRIDRTESLRALAVEGARFDIGNVGRVFNDPTLVLMFFTQAMQSRFQFVTDGSERIDGVVTYRIKFSETVRPSVIRNEPADLDTVVSGIAHLAEDGRIVRTDLSVAIGARRSARIRVRYQRDGNVEMLVPVSMDEDYRNDDGPGRGVSLISRNATYSDYQRLQASARTLPR